MEAAQRRKQNLAERWQPQEGPQHAYVHSDHPDVFYGGARGGGKSVGTMLAYREHAKRYGKHARGLLFRRTYPETMELERIGRQVFVGEGWTWRAAEREWVSPEGAELRLAHLDSAVDIMKYQGTSNTFLGFDELTNWPTLEWIDQLTATLRSAHGVPCVFRATGNPGGPGHELVKARYINADTADPDRLFIPSKVYDNKLLVANDPGYIDRLKKVGADWLIKAWLDGDWDIVPGSMLEGAWTRDTVIEPFDIPIHWKRFRSHDWGFAAPSATLWLAIDEAGCLYVYRELYTQGDKTDVGDRSSVDEVAARIKHLERHETKAGIQFRNNPADSAMWAEQGHAKSIAASFLDNGIVWSAIKKGPRSRVNGLQEMVRRLKAGKLKVFNTCRHTIRTVPTLVPDPNDPEDVDTLSADHLYDALRYACMSRRMPSQKPEEKKGPKPGTLDYITQPKLWAKVQPINVRL